MENKLLKGDRLIIENSDYNPLTDFYLQDATGDEIKVKFEYGIISGFTTYPKSRLRKHPIQKSQLTFSVDISGNECNSSNPQINDFSKYLTAMNNSALIFRAGLICLKEILNSFSEKQSRKNAIEDLIEIINSEDSLIALNSWIISTFESVPEDFSCKSIIEYSGENIPIAIYNSERRNNNVVTALFLVFYTTVMFQVGVLSKDTILKELNR
jgi:hypothetical protein